MALRCLLCKHDVQPSDVAWHKSGGCPLYTTELDLSRLAATDEEVASLTRPEREARVLDLVDESHSILERGIHQHVLLDRREVAGIVLLFSGGNDSTVMAHLFRSKATHAGHANTTIGIEKTRQFVRNTCAEWGLPLLERTAPREKDHYRALVLDQGFPGPGHHFKMFQRLKERALHEIRRELITSPYKQRIVFVAGRRRQESKRRASIPDMERIGSMVYVSPMVNWTKPDMTTYRLMCGDVPVNEVSDLIHMSGECLCGSFAHKGEREEISFWFPEVFDEVAELEALIADRADIPDQRKTWGWGTNQPVKKSKVGALCSSCDARFEPGATQQ